MIPNAFVQSLLKTRTRLMWGKRFNRSIHSHNDRLAVENESKSSLSETNKKLVAYAEQRRMVDARHVFDTMPERNVVSWTVMILGYAKHAEPHFALELYEHMHRQGVCPSDYTFVAVLKACSNLALVDAGKHNARKHVKDVREIGRTIYSQVVAVGCDSNMYVKTTLVDMYTKYDCMEEAHYVFEKSPQRSVVLWNAIATGYVKRKDGSMALDLYAQLRQEFITADDGTFVITLNACSTLAVQAEAKDIGLENGRILHQEIVMCGYESCMFVGTSLIDMYAKCMSMEDAQETFDHLPKRDVVSWNAMIWGYASKQETGQALKLSSQMQQEDLLANEETYLGIFKSCSALGTCKEHAQPNLKTVYQNAGRTIHSSGVKRGFNFYGVVGTSLVDMYAKWGSLADAQQLYDHLPFCDIVARTAMIVGYANNDKGPQALKLFFTMQQRDVVPDCQTFVAALKACGTLVSNKNDENSHTSSMRCLENGRLVHMQIVEGTFEGATSIGNALLDLYTSSGSMDDARSVFNSMPRYDILSWNSIMLGYAKEDEGKLALDIYATMQQKDILANEQTFVAALNACCTLASSEVEILVAGTSLPAFGLEIGLLIHMHLTERGFELDLYIRSSLVVMYATCECMDDARKIYDQLPHYDVVSCTAMILGYAEQERNDEAFELYADMHNRGLPRDDLAFVSILKACCQASFLDLCKEVYSQACKYGLEAYTVVPSMLVMVYAKCGNMFDAHYLFDALTVKSLLLWNTLISGYACSGDDNSAYSLLLRMNQEGIEPDGGTLLNVLNFCSHRGLVGESLVLFHAMNELCFVIPTLEHFTCMVDLFGRAGIIDNVMTIIESMPFQPDIVSWVNVLGICQQWSLLDFGKHAFDNVVSLSEKHVAAYVLMSNVYVFANMP